MRVRVPSRAVNSISYSRSLSDMFGRCQRDASWNSGKRRVDKTSRRQKRKRFLKKEFLNLSLGEKAAAIPREGVAGAKGRED